MHADKGVDRNTPFIDHQDGPNPPLEIIGASYETAHKLWVW